MIIIKTPRLYLRQLKKEDYPFVCLFLQDIEVMYAWEHSFTGSEVTDWIDENIMRYERDGYSYWAVVERETEKLIGVCGLLAEQADEEKYVGIGYIFNKTYWNKGYAYESASACLAYAFDNLDIRMVTAQIRPENIASRKLAEKLGMTVKKQFVKDYKGKKMLHLLYAITK